MRHLVIGSGGFIGSHLFRELAGRKIDAVGYQRSAFDVLESPPALLIDARTVYLCAARKGYADCDRNSQLSWRVNVDAQIAIGQHYQHSAFVVYISSDAVEFSNSAYAYQKRHVEAYMNTINAAVVRPGSISPERVGEFAKFLADIGTARKRGLARWS